MTNIHTKILVLGASGATGKLVVQQVLERGHHVKVIVRPTSKIQPNWINNNNITIVRSEISRMTVDDLSDHLLDCDSVACCLGHNPDIKGLFGKPKTLVTDAIRLVCQAYIINNPTKRLKIILMNTAGNSNRDLNEHCSNTQKVIIAFIS